ncbi:hypothetical protein D3C78_979250 [compost metagenome]
MVAVGAARIRQYQVEHRALGLGRQAQGFAGLLLPIAQHHLRQAMDHHIEETAHQQAEGEGAENKGQRMAGQEVDQLHA